MPLIIGFDLDMTLADTRPAIHYALVETSKETGVPIDADAAITRLGPPIQMELALAFPPEEVDAATDIFRKHMAAGGMQRNIALPGAVAAVAHVRSLGGKVVVLTAKHQPLAMATLKQIGVEADEVRGGLWAEQKAVALVEIDASVYVGDHVQDVLAARKAGVRAIAVASGGSTPQELRDAGAEAVLVTLEEFPALISAQ